MRVLVEVGGMPVKDVDVVMGFVVLLVISRANVDVVSVFIEELMVDVPLVGDEAVVVLSKTLVVDASFVDDVTDIKEDDVLHVMANVDVIGVLVKVRGLKVDVPLFSNQCEQTSWYIKEGQLIPYLL